MSKTPKCWKTNKTLICMINFIDIRYTVCTHMIKLFTIIITTIIYLQWKLIIHVFFRQHQSFAITNNTCIYTFSSPNVRLIAMANKHFIRWCQASTWLFVRGSPFWTLVLTDHIAGLYNYYFYYGRLTCIFPCFVLGCGSIIYRLTTRWLHSWLLFRNQWGSWMDEIYIFPCFCARLRLDNI